MTLSVRGPRWVQTVGHRSWLTTQTHRLFDFYGAAHNPSGGFYDLDERGAPMPTGWPPAAVPQTTLFQTTRMVHVYAMAHLWGRPEAASMLDHGMTHLWDVHRDHQYGGYFWSNTSNGPLDDGKQLYGHAFVLLAASSALMAGHPDGTRLLSDVSDVLWRHFWEDSAGAGREEFSRSWEPVSGYRGGNSNMHFVEALLAAGEATGEEIYLDRAMAVARRIADVGVSASGGRLPEHFTEDWVIDAEYQRDVFRPYGSTVGHWLEWSRLLLQLWVARGRRDAWLPERSRQLFSLAMTEGWDFDRGGFYFTVGWDGRPVNRDRYWWPCTEGLAAAHWLGELFGQSEYEGAYRLIWTWCNERLILPAGCWRHQLGADLLPKQDPWYGAPDIYHSAQALLISSLGATGSVVSGLSGARAEDEFGAVQKQ